MNGSTSATHWSRELRTPSLGADEVHVWRAHLADAPAARHSAYDCLSPDERDRAGRFHLSDDRTRFLLARLMLRALLGAYLDISAAAIRLRAEATGKPALVCPDRGRDIRFNISHAGDLVLVAVTWSREIGVDVERWRDDLDCDALAARFFAPAEVFALREFPAPARTCAFFDGWTRKEAFVKAIGRGLSAPLDGFEVSLAPRHPDALLRVTAGAGVQNRWTLRDIDAGTGYSAAVAAEGSGWRLLCRDWAPCADGVTAALR